MRDQNKTFFFITNFTLRVVHKQYAFFLKKRVLLYEGESLEHSGLVLSCVSIKCSGWSKCKNTMIWLYVCMHRRQCMPLIKSTVQENKKLVRLIAILSLILSDCVNLRCYLALFTQKWKERIPWEHHWQQFVY